jgi:type II secretory pathway pseudopilin PulG
MLIDVNGVQKLVITIIAIVVAVAGVYWVGYTNGRDAQILKQQKDALKVAEEVSQAAVAVQETMEKTDAKMERASSVSDDCNFVLNFDLTPCGVFD